MKTLLYIVAISFSSCENSSTDKIVLQGHTTIITKPHRTDKTNFYATTDSIKILSLTADTLVYSKNDFNEIVDNFPTLYQELPDHPDISYARSGYFKDIIDKSGNKKHISFGSEYGQDQYYILYAYFLKKKNDAGELATRRKNITNIFIKINSILGILNYGGTYYGHQVSRINAYAEYAVYLYSKSSNDFNKSYHISKQKKLYIDLLRQKVSDEISIDNEAPTAIEKQKRQKDLFAKVDELDKLIIDNFYLTQAQNFQFSNY